MTGRETKIATLFLLCSGHLGVALLFGWALVEAPRLAVFFLPAVLSQPLLLAVWAALPEAPARISIPSAVYVGVVSLYIWIVFLKFGSSLDVIYGLLLTIWLATFAALTGVCAVARFAFGWMIRSDHPLWQSRMEVRHQFSLLHLLWWMGGIAAMMAVGTWLLDREDLYLPVLGGVVVRAVALLLAIGLWTIALLPGVTCVGIVLDRPRWPKWLGSTFCLVLFNALFAVPVLAEKLYWIGPAAFGFAVGEIQTASAMRCEIGICGTVLATLVILRLGGWQPTPFKATKEVPSDKP